LAGIDGDLRCLSGLLWGSVICVQSLGPASAKVLIIVVHLSFVQSISNVIHVCFVDFALTTSALFGISLLSLLIAFEGFGVLIISASGIRLVDANTIAIAEADSMAHDHSMFFLVLSSLMTIIAWTGFVSLSNLITCVVYSAMFALVTTKAAINWAFPWNPANPFLTHTMDSFAFQFLLASKCCNTFTSLWNPRDRVYPAIWQRISYWCATLCPVASLVWVYWQYDNNIDLRNGILWSALVGSFNMTLSFRAKEILNFLHKDCNSSTVVLLTLFDGDALEYSKDSKRTKQMSLVFFNTLVVLMWAMAVMYFQCSDLDFDLFFPLIALLLFCCDSRALPFQWPPIYWWSSICAVWWYGSVFLHVFVMGWGKHHDQFYSINGVSSMPSFMLLKPHSVFGWDEEISIWTSDSSYLPILNLALSIVPYPTIFIALRRQNGESEEMLFVLTLLSAVAIIGGSVDCVRYLGIMGVLSGGLRCYEIHKSKKIGSGGERYI
jgi:hypothetical protein